MAPEERQKLPYTEIWLTKDLVSIDIANTKIIKLAISSLYDCMELIISNCPGLVLSGDIPASVMSVWANGESCKKFNFSGVTELE